MSAFDTILAAGGPWPRAEVIGDALLLQGDCLDVIPRLVSLGVVADLVLTDPPYRLASGGNSTGEMAGMFAHGAYDNSGALFPIVDWSDMAAPIVSAMAGDSDAIVMASDEQMQAARAAFEAAGLRHHRTLVWDKGTVTPNRWFMPCCEFGLYLWKGRARRITTPGASQLFRVRNADKAGHPTGKPVSLMAEWARQCSRPGALVFDPFMGSGSSIAGAVREGRRAIGIELQEKFFDIAVTRVLAETERGRFSVSEGNAVQGALL